MTIRISFLIVGLTASLLLGCSKKMPEAIRAVPSDADVVAQVEVQKLWSYLKTAMPKLLPKGLKSQIPPVETWAQQALQATGVDLNQLGQVTLIGYLGSQDKMAAIFHKFSASGLKGEKKGEINGLTTYSMFDRMRYAEVPNLGLVVSTNEEVLKSVIDTFQGKTSGLSGTDKAKLVERFSQIDKDLDEIRLYFLSGKMPGIERAPFAVKGGSLALNLDKGLNLTVSSDESGATQIKSQADIGLMALKTALALGKGDSMPIKLDDATKKQVMEVLNGINTKQDKDLVCFAYRGAIKPLLEKIIGLGMQSYAERATPESTPPDEPAEGEDEQEE